MPLIPIFIKLNLCGRMNENILCTSYYLQYSRGYISDSIYLV